MPSIHTLIPDIYQLISRKDGWFTDEIARDFSQEVARRLQEKFNEPERKPRLRLSKMGPRCPCALWHSIHHPELAEKLQPWAEIKFSYGHILEALAITLAKAAGHEVTGEQDELTVDGITGHRDCVIDGCVVDVKSSTSQSFIKFKDKSISQNDSFGYLDQLDGYLAGSVDDPLVTDKVHGYLLVIDKQLGHMCLYEHIKREQHIHERIADHKRIVALAGVPDCTCPTLPDGKSGNVRLAFPATYSDYKHVCKPGLRTFLYSSGPVYLTKVVRQPSPDIVEVDKDGKRVYN